MGMSHDFEVAIEEGATMVRVGTALFGGRPPRRERCCPRRRRRAGRKLTRAGAGQRADRTGRRPQRGCSTLYKWILIARAVISWVSADPRNPIVSFLHAATDPPIRLIRRRLPMSLRYFPLDIAFLVLFALVIFALYGLVQYARRLREPCCARSALGTRRAGLTEAP